MLQWQFVLGSGLSSRLIAWYGNGYGGYSHVDAILPDGSCLGARSDWIGKIPPGVQIRPKGYEKWKKRCVVKLDLGITLGREWERRLRGKIGAPYDQDSILGFILGRKLHKAGHWICSAVQTDVLEEMGTFDRVPVPPSQVTPNSLLLMLCAAGARASV